MKKFEGQFPRIRCVAFAPDGMTLASAGDGGLVRLWDPIRGKAHWAGHRFGTSRVNALAYDREGSTIVACYSTVGVHLWSTKDGRKHAMLPELRVDARTVEFHPVSKILLTAGGDTRGQVTLWDLETTTPVARFRVGANTWGATFAPDGRRVAVGTIFPLISIWNTEEFPEGKPFGDDRSETPGPFDPPHRWSIAQSPGARCLRFSPDGRSLAAASGWSIQLYDYADGRRLATFRGHRRIVTALAFSPDGRLLASSSHDGTVRFWDQASGEERGCFDWEIGKVESISFAPDGMKIAAGGDGGIVVWDVE